VANHRCPTGIAGLDEVLHGGLVPHRAYLARGGPGTGKTTLGLHFLRAGIERGERALLITLESAESQLRSDAATQGLGLDGVHVLDLSPTREFFAENQGYDYLCDNLIFLRYLEIDSELRKAIGVLKKRVGDFGKSMREMRITPGGLQVGEPLTGLRGVLTGTPEWVDRPAPTDPG
jgi:RecA/RadA recombinase